MLENVDRTPQSDTKPAQANAQADSSTSPPRLIVDDETSVLSDGQMRKDEFLALVQSSVYESVERIIAQTGRSTRDCPYLGFLFGHFFGHSARYIDRVLRQFVPNAATLRSATDAIPWIVERVRGSAEIWVRTGRIEGLPRDVPASFMSAVRAAGAANGNGQREAIAFKAKDGGARQPGDVKAVQSELGAGQSMELGVRSRMEAAFGHDFSQVRMHTDSKAQRLSSGLNARAFAIGNHVAFAAGEYRPGTMIGDALLAHELAHVVQQQGADSASPAASMGNEGALEQDADRAAAGVMRRIAGVGGRLGGVLGNAVPALRSGLRLQRCNNSSSNRQTPAASASPPPVTVTATPATPPAALLSMLPSFITADAGPVHHTFGGYQEFIGWSTTGRNGFIVQRIDNTWSVTDCATGAADTTLTPTPRYWEAWQVDGSGTATPGVGPVNDMYLNPQSPATSGSWTVDGRVYWVDSLDSAANFASGNVPDAGILLSTTTEPTNLGTSLLSRHAGGTWDCTGAHTPA